MAATNVPGASGAYGSAPRAISSPACATEPSPYSSGPGRPGADAHAHSEGIAMIAAATRSTVHAAVTPRPAASGAPSIGRSRGVATAEASEARGGGG